MKLQNTMFALVMMIGSLGAIGCNSAQKSAPVEAAPPAAAAEPQPAAEAPAKADEQTTIAAKTVTPVAAPVAQIPAPPPLRFEDRGRAPSTRHTWENGFWRYDAPRTNYVWVPGHWEDRSLQAPFAPPPPRVENMPRPAGDFTFVQGFWRWTGREYTWTPGRWEARRAGYDYMPSRWENVKGKWVMRDGYWKASVKVDNDRREPPRRAAADCDPPKPRKVKPARTTVQAKVAVTVKKG